MSSPNFPRIILVEPAGALNVGSVARVMMNMGLSQLVLVNPQCDHLGTEARQMAVHAAAILKDASVVASLPEALTGCGRAIATTGKIGRDRTTLPIPLETPRACLPWLLESDQPSALIFGREDSGLTTAELHYAQRLIQIPTHPDYASLNLAQAVAICCYELGLGDSGLGGSGLGGSVETAGLEEGRGLGDGEGVGMGKGGESVRLPSHSPSYPLAAIDKLERFYQQLEAMLLAIGYLYPHTATRRMQKFRRLLGRSLPSEAEVAMLQGIVSQVEWALNAKQGALSIDQSTDPSTVLPGFLESFSDQILETPNVRSDGGDRDQKD